MSTGRGRGLLVAALTNNATAYSIAVCNGNVKPFWWWRREKRGIPKQRKAISKYPRRRGYESSGDGRWCAPAHPDARLRAKVERKGGGRSGTKSDLRFSPP